MKELPPIPPNCPYFERANDTALEDNMWTFWNPHDVGIPLWMPESIGKWRGIIAAVARCGWLDEAREYKNIWSGMVFVGSDLKARKRAEKEFSIADKNAEAWREWGNQK